MAPGDDLAASHPAQSQIVFLSAQVRARLQVCVASMCLHAGLCKLAVRQMITRAGITPFHQSKQACSTKQTLTKPVAPPATIKCPGSTADRVRVAARVV